MAEDSVAVKVEESAQGKERSKADEMEVSAVAEQRLEGESKKNEHSRKERLRNLTFTLVHRFMIVIFVVVIAAIITLVIHHMAPTEWRWLSDSDLETLQTAVFSGAIFVAFNSFGAYLKERL